MTTEVANPEIPIGSMEPELGLGDITQSEEFVNIGPEPEFGEMTSRNERIEEYIQRTRIKSYSSSHS
jgi:hypothetical protein